MDSLPRLIGVCLSTIHDEDRFRFIVSLNKYAVENGYRLLIFNSCSDLYEQENADNEGASSVFRLIPYQKLSALILFSNFILDNDILDLMITSCHKYNVPLISIDKEMENCINFSFTYSDIFEQLCRHVIEDHGARKLFMVAGFKDNKFSDERIAAFRRALEANGIPYEPENVDYGFFWDGPTEEVLKKWFDEEKREIPDAIICANDTMAIAVSSFLQQRGLRIPEDCIVTGFDGIQQSQMHMPHITTCCQDYDKMGRLITETVVRLDNGEQVTGNFYVGFHMLRAHSCGCENADDMNVNLEINNLIYRLKLSTERQKMICDLQSAIAKMADINELPRILIDRFRYHTNVFGINDDIFKFPHFGENRKGDNSFSENIHILYQRYFWNVYEQCDIPLSELIPRYDLMTQRTDPIIVCAAHFIDMILGYCVFQPDMTIDEYEKMHTLMSAIGAALGNFHGRVHIRKINDKLRTANSELHRLSQRDYMTGLYNRRGFFDNVHSIIESGEYPDSTLIIISADLDELKYINDSFGHLEGDNAINTVSRALVSSSLQEEICARFGGDEFCVAAFVSTSDAGYYFSDFKERFLDYLHDYNFRSEKPYTVKASIGCCIMETAKASDLDAMIKIADEHMYTDKLRHKRQKQQEEQSSAQSAQ